LQTRSLAGKNSCGSLAVVGLHENWTGTQASGVRAASGQKNGQSNRKKTLKKRITNIEQGIMNVEVRYSIIIIFEK
jgi:hypothetical protein